MKKKPTTVTAAPVNPLPPATGGIDSMPPVHGAGKPIPGAVIETPGVAPVTNDAARIEPEKPKVIWPQPARPDYADTLLDLESAYRDADGRETEQENEAREAARKAAALSPDITADGITAAVNATHDSILVDRARQYCGMREAVARVVPCSPADKAAARDQFRAAPNAVATLFHSLPREIASVKVQYTPSTGNPVARRIRCDAKKLRSFAEQQPGSVATAILFEALTLATRTGRFLAGIDPQHMHSFTLTLKGDKPTCAPSRDAYVPFPE